MARTRRREKEPLGLWLAMVILAGVAALAYRSIDAAAETLGWVEHANRVLPQIEEVSAAYARATSARRAFVIAGDAAPLAEAPELDARLTRALAGTRASLDDNPVQRANLDTLGQLLGERLAALDASVARRRADGKGLRAQAVRRVPAPARGDRVRGHGYRPRHRAAYRSKTRRAGVGGRRGRSRCYVLFQL